MKVGVLSKLLKDLGKTVLKDGQLQISFYPSKELTLLFDSGFLTTPLDLPEDISLLALQTIAFDPLDVIDLLVALDKTIPLTLQAQTDTLFLLNGLPLVSVPVKALPMLEQIQTSVQLDQFKELVAVLKQEKKNLRKSFFFESEVLLLDLSQGEVRTINELDVRMVGLGERKEFDSVGLSKASISAISAFQGLSKKEVGFLSDRGDILEIESGNTNLFLQKTTVNKKLYRPEDL